MTTFFSPPQRGLDAAPIIYSLLRGHPASAVCESYIRNHADWLTTPITLLEVDAVLRKVYGVKPTLAAQKLAQFAAGPIVVPAIDAGLATSAMSCAASFGIDLADAVLLETCRIHRVSMICTDDEKFVRTCVAVGLTAETPIDSAMRQQITVWESANLPAKGLTRLLFHVRHWIEQEEPRLAQEFWNRTGAGSHLP
jgi:predicted nucleic acid-binding protein